jgi:hypothetical protein
LWEFFKYLIVPLLLLLIWVLFGNPTTTPPPLPTGNGNVPGVPTPIPTPIPTVTPFPKVSATVAVPVYSQPLTIDPLRWSGCQQVEVIPGTRYEFKATPLNSGDVDLYLFSRGWRERLAKSVNDGTTTEVILWTAPHNEPVLLCPYSQSGVATFRLEIIKLSRSN